MYYEFKIRATKDTPKGEKEVTEQYITDCELFAEAETKGMELTNGKGDVIAITRSNVREIVNPDVISKTFFKATIVDIFVNDNGDEKEQRYRVLVAADSVQEATHITQDYMKQGLQDMRLDGVVKTKILEIV